MKKLSKYAKFCDSVLLQNVKIHFSFIKILIGSETRECDVLKTAFQLYALCTI